MEMKIIGRIHTCYGEKFGVPRQPGLIDGAWGELVFDPEFRNVDAVRGLEGFSHVWLVFVFHLAMRKSWNPTVRPPRLGGNEKVGVFASRSPFRPNPVGLSCVRLKEIDNLHPDGPVLRLGGVDLVDGTPVLDIKPYIPYCDSLPDATAGFAHEPPAKLAVQWGTQTPTHLTPEVKSLIENSLSLDPRPAYQHDQNDREYGCLIGGFNVRWKVTSSGVLVTSCDAAG